MFENLREQAGKNFLKREAAKVKRDVQFSNLAIANSVGVVFALEDEAHFKQVKRYVKAFREEGIKTVKALGYSATKEAPHWIALGIEFDYFTAKDLNWYFKPTGTAVRNFIEEPFDILIDLTMEPHLPVEWVLRTAQSRLKVGRLSDDGADAYDLMIDVSAGKTLPNLMTQVNHYLTEINKKAS